jgi:hypothetical protein
MMNANHAQEEHENFPGLDISITKGPKRVKFFSSEEGNRASFRNVVDLRNGAVDKVEEMSRNHCVTSLSLVYLDITKIFT